MTPPKPSTLVRRRSSSLPPSAALHASVPSAVSPPSKKIRHGSRPAAVAASASYKLTTVLEPAAAAKAAVLAPSTAENQLPERLLPAQADEDGEADADLLELERTTMGKSWWDALESDMRSESFMKLKEFLEKEKKAGHKIFPAREDIYSWSRLTSIDDVRCVIVGQDPYHGPGQAHGLAFSVQPGVKVPPSLKNIYKELAAEYPGFTPPTHGHLARWSRESGVLLLNSTLTVRKEAAGSHGKKGWEAFTKRVLEVVAQRHSEKGLVFFAWGLWAQKMVQDIDQSKHLVLQSPHPSPLSARRGFFGTGHFKQADEWIKERYGKGVDWTTLPASTLP